MSKQYSNILSKRLNNQVFALTANKLDVITSQVTLRLMANQALATDIYPSAKAAVISDKLPIISVFDSLVSKGGAGSSGFTSYESITSQLKTLVAEGSKKIILNIDSPGGEVAGLFGLTDYMQKLKLSGVELIGITDGMCCSAAYAIGSACSSLYATVSSEIGSIGVITALVDATEADAQDGLKFTIVRSKTDKALGNPHEPTSEAVITEVEKKLSIYDNIFNSTVSANRPQLTIESIIAMKGSTFLGEEALSLNLIDAIIPSLQTFLDEQTSLASNKGTTTTNLSTRGNTMDLEQALAAKAALEAELTTVKASLASAEAKGKQDEQARLLGIFSAGAAFGLPVASITKVAQAGFSLEQATMNFELVKESMQAATAINTMVAPSIGVATINPTPAAVAQAQAATDFGDYL